MELMQDCVGQSHINFHEYEKLPDNESTVFDEQTLAKIERGADIDVFQDNRRAFKKECRSYLTVQEIEKACEKYDGTTLLGDRG